MFEGIDAEPLLAELERERRAIRLRVGGEQRYVAADEAGLYRDALVGRAARRPAGGVPRRRARRAARARRALRAHARPVHRARSCASATASTRAPCCASSSATASSCAASCAPAAAGASGATSRCCAACAAPRWRRCARRSSPPTSAPRRLPARPGRASTATRRAGAGHRPPARGARAAAGPRAAGGDLGARRAAAPHRRLLADVAGHALRQRRARVGRRRPARALRTRRAVLPRGRAADRTAASYERRAQAPVRSTDEPEHELLRARLAQSPCFFTDLLAELDAARGGAARGAVGSRLGGRGDQRRVGAAARAAPVARALAARAARAPGSVRRGASASRRTGRDRSRRCRAAGR